MAEFGVIFYYDLNVFDLSNDSQIHNRIAPVLDFFYQNDGIFLWQTHSMKIIIS